jgi:hypothetical protein
MDDLASALVQRLDAQLNTLRKKLVIGVQERNPSTVGGADAGIARRLCSCLLPLDDQTHSWIALRPRADPRHCVVTGRVVYDDHLDIGIRLREYTVDGAIYERTAIKGRYDHGN